MLTKAALVPHRQVEEERVGTTPVVVINDNIFKQCHNHHKRDPNHPDRLDDLHELLDFRRPVDHHHQEFAPYIQRIIVDIDDNDKRIFGTAAATSTTGEEEGKTDERELRRSGGGSSIRSSSTSPGWCFGLSCHPGFLFFPAALDVDVQHRLAYSALTDYCEAPYRTNIESLAPKSSEVVVHHLGTSSTTPCGSMWDLWIQQQQQHDEQQQWLQSYSVAEEKQQTAASERKTNHPPPTPRYYRCLEKLSWATLGYFYNWTQRCYHEDDYSKKNNHTGGPFLPPELTALGRVFARLSAITSSSSSSTSTCHCDHQQQQRTTRSCYNPSACIVNYYGEKGVMGGHRDELELALDQPIISISLGRPAVFLLGGKTIDDDDGPIIPMIVRSGDVLVLGDEARLNYHSMARLLPHTLPCPPMIESPSSLVPELCSNALLGWEEEDDRRRRRPQTPEDERFIDRYLTTHRININIRQVYH